MRAVCLLGIAFSLLPAVLWGQANNIGTPFIQNYLKETYGGGTQNWGFTQDEKGILYIANNEGLLAFNGQEWRIHPLPNRTIVRSIAKSTDGRIYVGGQDEIGYFVPDRSGFLRFRSLKPLIPAAFSKFEDVWDLIATEQGVFFRASDRIYHYDRDTVSVFSPGRTLSFLGGQGDIILVQDMEKGLLRYSAGAFREVSGGADLRDFNITELLPYHPDTLLLPTEKQGILFLSDGKIGNWPVGPEAFLREKVIQSACLLPGRRIALGTALGGMILLDSLRQARYWLTKQDDLQNNNVRSIFADRDHNLWLGLDNGIDLVLTNSPFTLLFPDGELEGTAYAAIIHQGKAYFGTSNGLYHTDWGTYFDPFQKDQLFRQVAGTSGQVWGLNEVDGQLLLGHHEGAFQIRGATARRIAPGLGYWTFTGLVDHPDHLISGTYYGLNLFEQRPDGTWTYRQRLPGLDESCRILAQSDQGDLWVSHPYRGIYQIKPNDALDSLQVDFFSTDDGLPSNLQNAVFSINGEIVICAEQGIFRPAADARTFTPHEEYLAEFGPETQVRRLVEDHRGNVWFVTQQEVGVLQVEDKGLRKDIKKIIIPELREKLVGGFEFIYPHDDHNVFFGAEKGLIHLDPSRLTAPSPSFQTIISAVFGTIHSDTLLFGGHGHPAASPSFPNRFNAFRFHFAGTHFENLKRLEYQYQLEGLEKDWSEWTQKNDREYTNLPAGTFTFKVRARLPGKLPGQPATYTFEILPPWYASRLAYFLYTLLGIAFLTGLVLIPRRKFEKEKQELKREHKIKEEAHRQAAEQSEKKIIHLKNEKLEAAVQYKNDQLISATMHLVQKNELLTKIGDELKKIRQKTEEPATKKELRKLIHLLKHDDQLDQDWEQFVHHFDQVHRDFFQRLRERYPKLTPKDHRLCAYLRMNLSTKEIAPLMNISVRGVEISRYRLRKKLELDSSDNLTEFLMDF